MKTRRFTDSVYGTQFVLMWNGTPEQFAKIIHRDYDKHYDGDGDFTGRCVAIDSAHAHIVIILLPKWREGPGGIAILAHELFHATERVMEFRDIPHSADTSECWAYYLDSILHRCLEILP